MDFEENNFNIFNCPYCESSFPMMFGKIDDYVEDMENNKTIVVCPNCNARFDKHTLEIIKDGDMDAYYQKLKDLLKTNKKLAEGFFMRYPNQETLNSLDIANRVYRYYFTEE